MPLPGYFGQYPPAQLLKPVENGHPYPQYLASAPQALQLPPPGGPDADHNGFQPHFYPAFVPFGPPAGYPYMVPRHDGQSPPNYMVFPMYPKVGGPNDIAPGGQGQSDEGNDINTDKAG